MSEPVHHVSGPLKELTWDELLDYEGEPGSAVRLGTERTMKFFMNDDPEQTLGWLVFQPLTPDTNAHREQFYFQAYGPRWHYKTLDEVETKPVNTTPAYKGWFPVAFWKRLIT